MKRGAIWAALAAVIVLLAVMGMQRWTMGACDIQHEIITPDGHTFHFSGPRLSIGTLEEQWPLQGENLPPVEHLSSEIFGMPGALYKGLVVKPRVLMITATEHGLTYKALMDMKARMQSALRWDRGDPGDPSIYRFTMNGVSRDLYVRYDSAVERRVGRPGRVVVIAVRLIAYDPFWYDPDTQEQVLDWGDTMLIRLVAAKVGGIWDNLGPPAAVAAGAGGNTHIQAMAVSPDSNYVYFGGDFQTFDNIAAANHIVRWNIATQAWEAVGGGLNARVRCLTFGPDGTLYAGGYFTDGSGGAGDPAADYIAQLDPTTNTWVNVGGGPGAGAVTAVLAIEIGHDGTLYVGGIFTDWDGVLAADYVARLPLPYAGGAWASLGAAAVNNTVYGIAVLPNGNIVIGGAFTLIGAVAYLRVAEWDPVGASFSTLGAGLSGICYTLCVGIDGRLYAGGVFATAGGVTVNNIAVWNGASWSDLAGGFPTIGAVGPSRLFAHPSGDIYASGDFQDAGGVPFADYIAKWNGFAWIALDVILPAPATAATRFAFTSGGDLYLGTDALAVSVPCGADNTVVNAGNTFALPIIEVKNAGQLGLVINEAAGGSGTQKREIPMNMLVQDGEIVTIDLSSGVKSCESNWRGNRLGDILPASDMATFCLESYPRANYGGVEGANLITVFITDAAAREHNDGGNQLSGWDNITGISQHNTDLGRLYASIVVVGGGFNRVDFYSDAARAAADLVAHTANYNGAGAQAIIADNASGLGGTITIDAVGAGDTDIFAYYTIVTMFWRNRWWDLDSAVS